MLGALEQRLLALVADALEGRDHLSVGVAGPTALPAAGEGAVRVGLAGLSPILGFEPRTRAAPPGTDETRRVRPLRLAFEAGIDVAQRPAAADGDAAAAARRLVLDDLARIGHALDAPELRDGSAFAGGGADQGYLVAELHLDAGTVPEVGDDGVIRARWVYRGMADVWPPEAIDDAKPIEVVSVLAAVEPLAIDVDDSAVPLGGTTHVHIRGLVAHRLAPAGTAPVQLAVRVASTLPPATRGSIASGDPGLDAGVRLVAVDEPVTSLEYHAPAALPGGAPVERVEVFLARVDGRRGLLLGSIVVSLRASP